MDSKYPTRKNADGTLKYGLIDSINKLIKDNNTGSTYTDDPYNTTTPFNKVVRCSLNRFKSIASRHSKSY